MNEYELIRFNDEDLDIDIRVSKEKHTAYLSQQDIAVLFNKSQKSISYYINKLQEEVWNKSGSFSKNFGISTKEYDDSRHRPINLYDLDFIMKLSERLKSNKGVILRNYVDDYFEETSLDVVEKPKIII